MSNKGFGDVKISPPRDGQRPLPRQAILAGRTNALERMAAGSLQTVQHELVDPERCRIWEGHNRDYGALTPETCADLIEGLKAQNRQEVPAIVRRVRGDPAFDFEVICGARRHWCVSWLRTHDHPEFRFLVEPRDLTDEEAFRLADLENRHRKDLSDYERARDYARAVDRYYDGSQKRMIDRLQVSAAWLSRFLELARLPDEVLSAFESPHAIRIHHASVLAPLLKAPATSGRVLQEAIAVAGEQARARQAGRPALPPASVLRRLSEASADKRRPARAMQRHSVTGATGEMLVEGRRTRSGGCELAIPKLAAASRAEMLKAIEELIAKLGG
jgi:ParB family chromosome partitioning protein